MSRKLGLILASSVVATMATQADLQFSFTYADLGSSTGFYDPTDGQARRDALTGAAAALGSYFPAYNTTIDLAISSTGLSGGTLATANSFYPNSPSTGFLRTLVQEKILHPAGGDPNLSQPDASLAFNFAYSWGYSDSVSGSSYDFKYVTMHELVHTLGFGSFISASGQGGYLRTPGLADVWTVFDQFLADSAAGTHKLITADFTFDSTAAQLTQNPGVFFVGPNALAANAGKGIPIYSPAAFAAGSSMSHTDDSTYTGVDRLLMNATVNTGQQTRTLSSYETAILTDLGYAMVPEPEAMACWTAAGLVGLLGWRRVRVRQSRRA